MVALSPLRTRCLDTLAAMSTDQMHYNIIFNDKYCCVCICAVFVVLMRKLISNTTVRLDARLICRVAHVTMTVQFKGLMKIVTEGVFLCLILFR